MLNERYWEWCNFNLLVIVVFKLVAYCTAQPNESDSVDNKNKCCDTIVVRDSDPVVNNIECYIDLPIARIMNVSLYLFVQTRWLSICRANECHEKRYTEKG